MMMRPRRYGVVNRCIHKSLGRALNQTYRNRSYSSRQSTDFSGTWIVVLVVFFVLVALGSCH